MKKVTCLILIVLVFLAMVSCEKSIKTDIVISPEFYTYSVGVKEISVKWKNNIEENICFSPIFSIEKKQMLNWEEVQPDISATFTTVLTRLMANSMMEYKYYIAPCYNLQKGKYRIITSYIFEDDKTYVENPIYFEFEIE